MTDTHIQPGNLLETAAFSGAVPPFDLQQLLALVLSTSAARHAYEGDFGQKPYAIHPENYTVTDLEYTLAKPTRKRASVRLTNATSFVDYVLLHRHVEHTHVYGDPDKGTFVAVFDDHSEFDTGWRENIASFTATESIEWNTWSGSNKSPMKQADFAQFIEDNLPDIREPDAADILEVSRSLQAKKAGNFSSAIRLDNGDVQFTYEEKTDVASGKGQIKVPEKFVIAIPVYQGGPAYKIEARLRYRITDGQLSMWYDLLRPHKSKEHALKEISDQIKTETNLQLFVGSPSL